MNKNWFSVAQGCMVLMCLTFVFSQDMKEGIEEVSTPAQIQEPQAVSASDASSEQNTQPNGQVSDSSDTRQTNTTSSSDTSSVTHNAKQVHVSSGKKAPASVEQLRSEANELREEVKILSTKAEQFKSETDDIDDDIEDLEDLSEELENEAEKLLKQAFELQTYIRGSDKPVTQTEPQNAPVDAGEPDTIVLMDRKQLMEKMRTSADELLSKAKEISVQVRQMKETSSTKDDLADKFEEKAEEFDTKADELLAAADNLEEEQNAEAFSKRFPILVGHQIRFSAVPPYDDEEPHILWLSGLRLGWYFTQWGSIGIDDITLRIRNTIDGSRTAITASPAVSFSTFLGKRSEIGASVGAAIQGQVGADRRYAVAVAPFCKLINQNWVSKHFSIGPVCSFNVVARGDFFARVIPSDHAGVLPDGAWWMDCGIAYTFHF